MQRKVTERESVISHDHKLMNKSFFGCGLDIRTNPEAGSFTGIKDKVQN